MKILAGLVFVLVLAVACSSEAPPEEVPVDENQGEEIPVGAPVVEEDPLTEEEIQEIEAEVDDLTIEDDLDFSELDGLDADLDQI